MGTAMKTAGLIGGTSWESTIPYYRIINEAVRERMGGLHSAKIVLYSLEFGELEKYQSAGDWDSVTDMVALAAYSLEMAGADFVMICSNTLHKVAPVLQKLISVPVLHIGDTLTDALRQAGIKRAALLGTELTMGESFYKERLERAGIEVLTPEGDDAQIVDSVVFRELCMGIVSDKAKSEYLRIIDGLVEKGAQGVILGCTEMGMLLKAQDTDVPIFDTAAIHAQKAAELMFES
mgnify:CR=1 FL=1